MNGLTKHFYKNNFLPKSFQGVIVPYGTVLNCGNVKVAGLTRQMFQNQLIFKMLGQDYGNSGFLKSSTKITSVVVRKGHMYLEEQCKI